MGVLNQQNESQHADIISGDGQGLGQGVVDDKFIDEALHLPGVLPQGGRQELAAARQFLAQ